MPMIESIVYLLLALTLAYSTYRLGYSAGQVRAARDIWSLVLSTHPKELRELMREWRHSKPELYRSIKSVLDAERRKP